MGFEIMGVQVQDTSQNVGIKNGPSTSNMPLMVSLKGRSKTRAQLAPLKGWQPKESIRIWGKHPISTNQESKIFPSYHP